jgi:hypothetical protein
LLQLSFIHFPSFLCFDLRDRGRSVCAKWSEICDIDRETS